MPPGTSSQDKYKRLKESPAKNGGKRNGWTQREGWTMEQRKAFFLEGTEFRSDCNYPVNKSHIYILE